jgi:MFS family permease
VGTLTGVICLIPGGALTDAVRWKRGLVAMGILAIAGAALMLALRPSLPIVFGAELLHGVASAVLAPAIAAISLGLAGRHGMSSRVGRNFRFAAAGNALTAAVMGGLAAFLSNRGIFIASALLCLPALLALWRIKWEEIDYVRARNASKRDDSFDLQKLTDLSRNWSLLRFGGCMVLFHLANASMLPLVSQNLAHDKLALSPCHGGTADSAAGCRCDLRALGRLLVRALGPQAIAPRRLCDRDRAGAAVRVQ